MQTSPASYAKALAKPQKAPVYIVAIEGIATRYSTGPVLSPAGATKQLMTTPQLAGSNITPDEGKGSVGGAVFRVLDKELEITKIMPVWVPLNKVVNITQGFAGIPESQYIDIYKGRIVTMAPQDGGLTWEFTLQDFVVFEKTQICQNTCYLTADIDAVTGTLPVDTTQYFPTATAGVAFLMLDNEIISYTGVTANSFTGCTRGISGTTSPNLPVISSVAAAHSQGGTVQAFYFLQGNVVDLALKIITSTGLGTNGPYDALPGDIGLGIPQSMVNVAKFEAERDRWLTGYTFRFFLYATIEGKKFLETEIYQFINAYQVTDGEGRISFHVYAPPLPTQDLQHYDDSNSEAPPAWASSLYQKYFFNEFDLSYDFSPLAPTSDALGHSLSQYYTRDIYDDSTSQVKFGSAADPLIMPKVLQSKGIYSDLLSAAKIQNLAVRFLKRFANPTPVMTLKPFFSQRLVENGDVVLVSTGLMPNPQTGRRGFQNKMVEILSIQEDCSRGGLTLTALDTSYSYGKKYGAISPSAQAPIFFPNYLAASSSQRLYAFWGKKNSALNTNAMSNGDDGYYITP